MHSWNASTSKQLLDLYSQFLGDIATKGIRQFPMYNWTEQGIAIQLELISQFSDLEFLDAIFTFPSIVNGEPMERFKYPNEQYLWCYTSLHYVPPPSRSVDEEKAVLKDD
jgi:hypothetical protein